MKTTNEELRYKIGSNIVVESSKGTFYITIFEIHISEEGDIYYNNGEIEQECGCIRNPTKKEIEDYFNY